MGWPQYRVTTMVIAPGGVSPQLVAGKYLRALTSTGTLDVYSAGSAGTQSQPLPTRVSLAGEPGPNGPSEIGPVIFKNNTASTITAQIATSNGPIGDDRGDSDAGTIVAVNLTGSSATVTTSEAGASTAGAVSAFTSVASATLLAANAARKGATIYNEGGGILYLLLGAGTASLTNYTAQIQSGGYWELPFRFTGQITAIYATAGTARVQEVT